MNPAYAEWETDSGKYVVVWKKQDDGNWRLHVDIWNSDLPAPGQQPEMKE